MIKKLWDHLEEYILLPMLVVSVALVTLQIIMRYVFSNSLSWSEELARYLFVWQLWIGISYAAKKGTHIRITMIKNKLNEKAERVLETVVLVVWISFMIFVSIKGFELMEQISGFGQRSVALGLPMQYAYAAVPVGSTLAIFRLISKLWVLWRPDKGVLSL